MATCTGCFYPNDKCKCKKLKEAIDYANAQVEKAKLKKRSENANRNNSEGIPPIL